LKNDRHLSQVTLISNLAPKLTFRGFSQKHPDWNPAYQRIDLVADHVPTGTSIFRRPSVVTGMDKGSTSRHDFRSDGLFDGKTNVLARQRDFESSGLSKSYAA
jgi:hypothetical protein